MKTKHLMQRIKIMLQAIYPLHRNTFQKNTESVCSVQLLTLNTFYSANVKCWTSVILGQPISRDKRRIVKMYKLKNFCFFINPIPTLIQTALKALKKTVQMYEIIYNFCTLLITENSMKLAVIHRECIVNDTHNSLHLIHTQHRHQFSYFFLLDAFEIVQNCHPYCRVGLRAPSINHRIVARGLRASPIINAL